ncbi:MAG: GNAT family N-acetyltransferase [Candidatus Caenarcaniphilales bacterium]|nr:GNAT family N-acetyltransferase [Candidatus Caenarcaniphilales bacterium]
MNFEIRKASNEDLEDIHLLISECYSEVNAQIDFDGYDDDLIDIEKNYFAKGGEFILLEANGLLIGTQSALPFPQKNKVALFKRLYVHKKWRGTKAAKILMEWAINWALNNKFEKIEFFSDSQSIRAHKFFNKFGFLKKELIPASLKIPYEQYRFYGEVSSLSPFK